MAGNTFGQVFRVTTWGESHGPALGAVIDGCPPRLELSEADLQPELDRRRPGQSSIVSPRKVGSNLAFSYTTVTSQTYYVESKTNIVGTNWTSLQTNPGTGALKSFTNSATSDRQRYFRLRTQ